MVLPPLSALALPGLTLLDIGVCCTTLIVAVTLYTRRQQFKQLNLPYPPGPKGLPIIGNVFDNPEKQPWVTYRDWSRQMGSPIIRLDMMGRKIVVINEFQAAVDLFEKRGSMHLNRPRFPMMNEACGGKWLFVLTDELDHWELCRHTFDSYFRKAEMTRWRAHQLSTAHALLTRLLESPERFEGHIHHITAAMFVDIAYGIEAKQEDDEFIDVSERALRGLENCNNTGIIDIFPWLQHIPSWIPGMRWKQSIDVLKTYVLQMVDAPYERVKEGLNEGLAKPCVTTDLMARFEDEITDNFRREYAIKSIAGTVYVAGYDTTASVLNTFCLVMTLFPDVQRRAQAEIDRVVGPSSDRLPEFSDQESLPYITAIVKEILRWAPPLPLGLPHRTSTADTYNGYYIPKDCMVLGNSWAILRDPEAYPDPDTFNPSRFLTHDGTKIDPTVRDPEVTFGYGRRIWPGRFVAHESLWITFAYILATFEIERKVGDDGKLVPMPEEMFVMGLVSHPTKFSCSITPRSEASVRLVRAVGVDRAE
ncbi:CyP450 monooxygenase [Stereum hirsutum FP-91666 SS1]|uniref:CyP450 monooxygenase n=1 Tax=Stereum hirsutum (strain FP-91666) TaxID=721885 RepID=UPI000444A003|nr:CyP450 monooxygenase [Stereum hirsutum FP-91666 SS1]EIM84081.1 CyP450 monooxygenase [Stereum hirsutum FP-91666 SS1]